MGGEEFIMIQDCYGVRAGSSHRQQEGQSGVISVII